MRDVEFTPLTGAPVRLSAVAAAAARAAAVLEDARGRVLRVRGAVDGQRSGAVTAARELLSDVAFRLGTCTGVLAGASATLREHAAALAEHQEVARLALARRAEALDRERRAQADVEEAHRSTWNAFAPDHAGAALRVAVAQGAAASARADVLAAEAEWRRARDGKAAESARAAALIGALGDVRLVTSGVGAGLGAAQLAASWERGLHAAELTATTAWTRGASDRAAASAELRRVLSAAGGDPGFWTAFWGRATPDDLYRAVGLDPVDDALAASLGAGARAWAATATTEELEEFGRQAVESLGASPLGLDERAALAELLLPPRLPGPAHASAAEALFERRTSRPDDDVDILSLAPVTSVVATGLMLHPLEAFEHLAPSDPVLAAERAHAWFGIAPPDGWPDGGGAVAGAFAAAVLAGSQSSSRGNQARAALLASHATLELPRGLLAGPTPSDLASERIARAYEAYVPVFSDASALKTDAHEPRPPGIVSDFQLAEDLDEEPPHVVQPALDPFALRDVIAATSRTPGAGDAWLGVGDRYQDAMLDMAFGTSAREGIALDDQKSLAHESLRDAAAIAGALQIDTLRAAERSQAAIDGAASGAMFLTSLASTKVPVPPAVSTSATSLGGELLPELLPTPVEDARREILAREPELRDRYAGAAQELALEHTVERGVPRAEAHKNWESLAPDSKGARTSFGDAYNQMADLRRRLGENP